MPRNDDDSGEFERPARKSGSLLWLWLTLVAVGCVLVCGGVGAAMAVWMGGRPVASVTGVGAGGESPAKQSPGRKTFTRSEVSSWWTAGFEAKRWQAADIKAKFGLPDTTFKKSTPSTRTPGGLIISGSEHVVYEYRGLSVDAQGSGKTDSLTRFTFFDMGGDNTMQTVLPVEFIP